MRAYILIPFFTPDAPPFPAGTPAFDDPAAALEAARASGAELVYMYSAAVVDGHTVKELCPRHPVRVYPTRRTVLHYDGQGYRLRDTRPDAPKAPTTQRPPAPPQRTAPALPPPTTHQHHGARQRPPAPPQEHDKHHHQHHHHDGHGASGHHQHHGGHRHHHGQRHGTDTGPALTKHSAGAVSTSPMTASASGSRSAPPV